MSRSRQFTLVEPAAAEEHAWQGEVTPSGRRQHAGLLKTAGARPLRPDRPGFAETLDNLPVQLTRFIGREHEVAQVRQLVSTERMVTLTGVGGVGKTRLALEVAAEMRGAFGDGVWLVELESLANPMLLPQALATPLGLRAEGSVPLQSVLVDFLRPRHVLLVLDNCEHLVRACAELSEGLLRVCPRVHILATSREPLRIAGETAWRVPSLRLPLSGALASADGLLSCESVRLFADRASAVAGCVVTSENAAAAARLCERLDGIPLAIELAAVRAGVLSIADIANRLDDRFRLLVGHSRVASTRQRTLRGTIDWSYDLLSPPEQDLLHRVSVFAGSWTLDAAEALCTGDEIAPEDVLDLLSQLVDKSLVLVEQVVGGRVRYRLLETVRHYASEKLRQNESAATTLQLRHCAFYCALAKDVASNILWDAGDPNWLVRLDPEQGNIRAALAWSFSAGGEVDLGLELVGHLGHFWYIRGDRGEGRGWLKQALARGAGCADREADRSFRSAWAWALLWAGGLAHGQSDYDEARGLLEQALNAFKQLDDRRGMGWALSFLGYVARARADLQHAAVCLEQAVAALRAIGDELSMILPLAALGFTAAALGEMDRASMLLEHSVLLAKKTRAGGRLAMVLIYLGQARFARGEMVEASTAFAEGLKVSRAWESAWGMAECLEGLSLIAGTNAQPRRAARLLGAATRLREPIGAAVHPIDRADHEQIIATIRSAIGNRAFAEEFAVGGAMSLERMFDYALGTDAEPAARENATPSAYSEVARLTPREREVAELIASGMSNRQIAEKLVVTVRTATNHIEHILNKLDFHSRAQIATWVTQHRLAS